MSAAAPDAAPGTVRRALTWLRTPEAVRARAAAMLALAEQGGLAHFTVERGRLPATATYVVETIRASYPGLDIPHHARWRHFAASGVDRWGEMAQALAGTAPAEIARIRIDLAVMSVLLDAGAGPGWRYREGGTVLSRSEGLAVASLHAFRAGLFSGDRRQPWRADRAGLLALTPERLAAAFQVGADNPLAGLNGRAALLRRLGAAVGERPGEIFDRLAASAGGSVAARDILIALIVLLAPVWPPRLSLAEENLGDVWHHPAMVTDDLTSGLVPFHKLPQWLAYSLVEVFETAGVAVTGLDALTGLAEYRNGGLLIDGGVLALRDPGLAAHPLAVDHPAVVEWRALTVALLDEIAELVRAELRRSPTELPLSHILEGGTWAAGRRIAWERRADGGPPLRVASDGTVF